jgi:CheY-like chemotaxis protein
MTNRMSGPSTGTRWSPSGMSLVVDVIMPLMKGTELADRLQAVSPSTKVLLMAGYHTADIAHTGRALLMKPFRVEGLVENVRAMLARPSAFARPRRSPSSGRSTRPRQQTGSRPLRRSSVSSTPSLGTWPGPLGSTHWDGQTVAARDRSRSPGVSSPLSSEVNRPPASLGRHLEGRSHLVTSHPVAHCVENLRLLPDRVRSRPRPKAPGFLIVRIARHADRGARLRHW